MNTHKQKCKCKSQFPLPCSSSLDIKESRESLERTQAELNVPDPDLEKARAILNKGKEEGGNIENTQGNY